MRRLRHGIAGVGVALVITTLFVVATVAYVEQPGAAAASVVDLDADQTLRLQLRPGLRVAAGSSALGDSVIAPPPDSFDGPAEPMETVAGLGEFGDVTPEGGTWAVVIGINNYPGTRSDLRSAVNDALDVDRALDAYGVEPRRRLLLTDRKAGADNIRRGVAWLNAHAGPDATAVFFFAGHVRKLGRSTEALVGADGATITDAELARLLEPLQARRTWLGIAACYGGGFTEALAPGRVLSAAADAHHLAYENSDFGRSYMVEYMVRRAMLGAKASESVEAAFDWSLAELRRDYPNRVPFQIDWAHGDLTLGRGFIAPPPPPAAKASPPPPSGDRSGGSGGSSPQPSPTPTRPPSTPPRDSCSTVTLGVLHCS